MTDDPGPVLTLGQAVKATGTARSTLQRRLAADAIPGAHRTDSGTWAIPVAGLIAAGLAPRTTPADEPDEPLEVADADTVTELRADLDEWKRRAATAEAVAAERARTIDTLTQAVAAMSRALPAGTPAAVAPEPTEPEPPARRWLPRRWRN